MRRELLICMLLIVVTLLVFEQVRNHEFVNLDDPLYVTENHHVKAGLSPKSFIQAFTDTPAGYWIPLTWLSLMLDFEFYGLEAGGYHLTNLLFHIANALLLFLLLKRMYSAPYSGCLPFGPTAIISNVQPSIDISLSFSLLPSASWPSPWW